LLLSQIVGGSPFAEEKASPEKTEEVEILESESESDEASEKTIN
jgi:hypothetical protein